MAHKIKKEDYLEYQVRISDYAKALSHPARISIIELLLKSGDSCCGDIVGKLPIAQASVSQHLKELKDAGLITATEIPPKVLYCINNENWNIAKRVFCMFFDRT
jgi:ArsR family transcriptional regulator, arsenate/arsenite/antimonite-responsive transcriptional repressor